MAELPYLVILKNAHSISRGTRVIITYLSNPNPFLLFWAQAYQFVARSTTSFCFNSPYSCTGTQWPSWPPVYRLEVYLPGKQNVTWNEDSADTMNEIIERAAAKDTTLTAWFAANARYEDARNLYYQDFPIKFVFNKQTHKWTP